MRTTIKSSDGYVALLAVLIMGAAALTVAVSLLVGGTDSQKSILVSQQSVQARHAAAACAEEALQQMYENTNFTGSGNLTVGQGACTYAVANTGGSNRTVDATGTVGGVVKKLKVYATITTSVSITSWQEVS